MGSLLKKILVGMISIVFCHKCLTIDQHRSSILVNSQGIEVQPLIPSGSRQPRRSIVSGGLFSIISFDNLPCIADTGDIGTCYSSRDCNRIGGFADGTCARNYGVCCVIQDECGTTVYENNTYFINDNFPGYASSSGRCCLTVIKAPGAETLFLDFEDFSLEEPTANECDRDFFSVEVPTPSGTEVYPGICGTNTFQSLSIDIRRANGPISLCFNELSGSPRRRYKIRISQFYNGDACNAPQGCFQFTRGEIEGEIISFNGPTGQQIYQDTCYRSCIEMLPGYCDLEFELDGVIPFGDGMSCANSNSTIEFGGELYCQAADPVAFNLSVVTIERGIGSNIIPVTICTPPPGTNASETAFELPFLQREC